MNTKWDLRFLKLAAEVSTWSKDPSTKCGAVITRDNRIISLGFNGFPKNCNDDPTLYHNRELKYSRVIHAEINAILFANNNVEDCTIYTHPFAPCSRCAAVIIQSGITRVVAPLLKDPKLIFRWKNSLDSAYDMYQEACVKFKVYNINVPAFHNNGYSVEEL